MAAGKLHAAVSVSAAAGGGGVAGLLHTCLCSRRTRHARCTRAAPGTRRSRAPTPAEATRPQQRQHRRSLLRHRRPAGAARTRTWRRCHASPAAQPGRGMRRSKPTGTARSSRCADSSGRCSRRVQWHTVRRGCAVPKASEKAAAAPICKGARRRWALRECCVPYHGSRQSRLQYSKTNCSRLRWHQPTTWPYSSTPVVKSK